MNVISVTGALYMNTTPSVCMPDEEKASVDDETSIKHVFMLNIGNK
jgi:hypothetical protein